MVVEEIKKVMQSLCNDAFDTDIRIRGIDEFITTRRWFGNSLSDNKLERC